MSNEYQKFIDMFNKSQLRVDIKQLINKVLPKNKMPTEKQVVSAMNKTGIYTIGDSQGNSVSFGSVEMLKGTVSLKGGKEHHLVIIADDPESFEDFSLIANGKGYILEKTLKMEGSEHLVTTQSAIELSQKSILKSLTVLSPTLTLTSETIEPETGQVIYHYETESLVVRNEYIFDQAKGSLVENFSHESRFPFDPRISAQENAKIIVDFLAKIEGEGLKYAITPLNNKIYMQDVKGENNVYFIDTSTLVNNAVIIDIMAYNGFIVYSTNNEQISSVTTIKDGFKVKIGAKDLTLHTQNTIGLLLNLDKDGNILSSYAYDETSKEYKQTSMTVLDIASFATGKILPPVQNFEKKEARTYDLKPEDDSDFLFEYSVEKKNNELTIDPRIAKLQSEYTRLQNLEQTIFNQRSLDREADNDLFLQLPESLQESADDAIDDYADKRRSSEYYHDLWVKRRTLTEKCAKIIDDGVIANNVNPTQLIEDLENTIIQIDNEEKAIAKYGNDLILKIAPKTTSSVPKQDFNKMLEGDSLYMKLAKSAGFVSGPTTELSNDSKSRVFVGTLDANDIMIVPSSERLRVQGIGGADVFVFQYGEVYQKTLVLHQGDKKPNFIVYVDDRDTRPSAGSQYLQFESKGNKNIMSFNDGSGRLTDIILKSDNNIYGDVAVMDSHMKILERWTYNQSLGFGLSNK